MKRGKASRFLAGSLLAVLVASSGTAWSHTYGTEGSIPTGPEPGAAPDAVTLITGDVVRVLGERAVSVTSAPRRDGHTPNFSVRSPPAKDAAAHELYVIPDDALPLIEQGRLDRSLFDVQLLRSNGFGVTRAIPAITTFPESTGRASLLKRGQELAASTATHALHSVHATALTVDVDKAAAFWRGMTAEEPAGRAGALGSGVERLLLDRPVRALLDKSVPQVRAPEAWKAGFDGTGVKVAVLDTGIDETHPDLAGKVVASESFVEGEPVADGYGHGTHVASIVAGTGAASGGAGKGVAPGARLVVGKVLGNDGSGLTSGIIAGMEWATEQGARVVNMSLGGPAPAEESEDLMAAAVNRLTASSGALFVIAAGNEGSAASTVASPGVAESALTVAAVDSADRTADFSSRGPLPYDYPRVLKPDIAAPGVAIAAARAAGTSMGTPVDDHYTRASGTSMAAPHVAGAAAVLAQRRPGWKAAELKHALTASAAEIGGSAFEVGTGRLDVAAAIEQTVVSQGALDLGRSDVPSAEKVTRTLAYTATGPQDVALTIKASLRDAATGAPAPEGAFTVPGTVAVPGGGEASVQVTLDPARLPEGRYTGTVTATDADGRVVRTAVGFVREPETTKLVVWISDPNGLPCKTYGSVDCSASSGVQAMNLDDPAHSAAGTPGEPFRLRPGRYALAANVSFALDREQHVAVLALPEVRVAVNPLGVQSARMSLSAARQVRVQTDRPSETYGGTLKFQRRVGEWSDYNAWITGYDNSSMWALPASPPTVGQYLLTADLQRGAVPISGSVVSGESMKLTPRYDTYADLVPKFPASVRARLVEVGATLEPAEAARLSGAIALVRPKRIPLLDLDASYLDSDQEAALADAGAIGALVWSPDMAIGVPGTTMTARRIPVAGLPAPQGDRLAQRLADGPVTVKLTGGPASPYLYSLKFYERDAVGSLQYRVGDRELAQVPVDHRAHGPGQPEVWRYNLSTWPAAGESDSITAGVLSFAPARTTELIGPARDGQTWSRWTDYDGYVLAYRLSTLKAGSHPAEVANPAPAAPGAAVAHPLLARPCTSCRQGDTLLVRPTLALPDPSLVTDPVPGSHLVGTSPAPVGLDARDVTLFEGDRQIPAYQEGRYAVPAAPATLRLVYERKDTYLPPSFRFGRAMRGEWTFRSERPATGSAVQPLLHIRYAADLNERDEAPRGGSTLRLTAYREAGVSGSPLAELSLAASFDDGATWTDLRISGRGDQRSARLPAAPAGATAVSLRLAAADQAGSSVRHELPKAFGLTG